MQNVTKRTTQFIVKLYHNLLYTILGLYLKCSCLSCRLVIKKKKKIKLYNSFFKNGIFVSFFIVSSIFTKKKKNENFDALYTSCRIYSAWNCF